MPLRAAAVLTMALLLHATSATPQATHRHHQPAPDRQRHESAPKTTLQPAEGAAIQIITPKEGQVFKGDAVPIEFTMTKGKRGEHVHAYVDGELMGMFKTTKGTLTGIKPGKHTLELRIATTDHNIELDATDRVSFITQ
ncbi:MAG TPA: hypothetical protein VNO43_02510 [Candidatus Eisenbacteria bacterium]|nr:hypothetical protein [Candidatus Eisenbacteria bacterium]